MRKAFGALAAGLLFASGTALAQPVGGSGLEITPTFGYRWGGSMSTIPTIREFDTKDNISYGVILGKRTPGNSAVELQWTHFQGDVEATFNNNTVVTAGPLKRDDILLNGTWYAYRASTLLPYFTGGLGCSIFSSEGTSTTGRFAWNLGVGLRKEISDRFALRVGGNWTPVWITTGTGIWCEPYFPYYCYSAGTGESYDQFEVAGGLTIKL